MMTETDAIDGQGKALHHLGAIVAPRDRPQPLPPAEDRWCILRMAGPRTLTVTRSLISSGVEAWTPMAIVGKRRGRSRDRVDADAPMLPTFAFARAGHLSYLLRCLSQPSNPHPDFSIFRFDGKFPLIADAAVETLRESEWRAKQALSASYRPTFTPGHQVRVNDPAWSGMSGIVEDIEGKYTLVGFGGMLVAKIDTFLLESDVIDAAA